MGQHAEETQQRINNQNKQQQEEKYRSAAYRPDQEVTLTGEQMFYLREMIMNARNQRVHVVTDTTTGKQTGISMSQQDMDLDQLWSYFEQIHRQKVDNEETIPIEQLREELKEQEEDEGKSADEPVTEQQEQPNE